MLTIRYGVEYFTQSAGCDSSERGKSGSECIMAAENCAQEYIFDPICVWTFAENYVVKFARLPAFLAGGIRSLLSCGILPGMAPLQLEKRNTVISTGRLPSNRLLELGVSRPFVHQAWSTTSSCSRRSC
jgi:hypothetical protein